MIANDLRLPRLSILRDHGGPHCAAPIRIWPAPARRLWAAHPCQAGSAAGGAAEP